MLVSRVVVVFLALFLAACPGTKDVQCEENSNCDLGAGGVCTLAPTGNQWCAYPDPECPSGTRFSDEDVGDGLAGACTDRQLFELSVSVGGSAPGSVTSDPTGLTCDASTCSQSFPIGCISRLVGCVHWLRELCGHDGLRQERRCLVRNAWASTVGAARGQHRR
jgi:hypothetical protein